VVLYGEGSEHTRGHTATSIGGGGTDNVSSHRQEYAGLEGIGEGKISGGREGFLAGGFGEITASLYCMRGKGRLRLGHGGGESNHAYLERQKEAAMPIREGTSRKGSGVEKKGRE